ncbi:MAG TPA: hypothetical protein VMF07_05120 [Solirubrobacteraceae bacterium]|nr:hypothetical protein [Solirubrobacteraceae bacterium]
MSDINALLKSVAPGAEPPRPEVVDGDLARGRAALVAARRRGRVRRGALGAVSLVVVAAVAVLLIHPTHGGRAAPGAARQSGSGAERVAGTGGGGAGGAGTHARIQLVDYTGAQLAGFTVDQVPAGWQLSTSTSYALLITPDGSTNNDPADFEGKLAVLTSSTDQHGLGPGARVTVDGQPGRVHTSGGVLILSYNAPNGFGIDIQAPSTLGWGAAQIVAFAEGVHVTANAVHSHG